MVNKCDEILRYLISEGLAHVLEAYEPWPYIDKWSFSVLNGVSLLYNDENKIRM